ncbi:hypothetical protein PRIPAC_95966 [Pristionchus pacificus]|uniref:Uncharacterized protein n=1 Tax=Pristionchus pacificus TaxID=54126 RepID=A0A2A6D2X3_PRIPA|nr:hypothetical protein PRIPAC_95966 [Pristionchus pacificus]|eukprot:PDM84643.1 hypothetical protein PRIPAC_33666 [Pristionchus pacificus]
MAMLIVQLLLLVVTQIMCMPDTMCFTPKSDGGRSVLEKTLNKKTQRACEVACGDRADVRFLTIHSRLIAKLQCEAYSYRASNCTLLGAIVPSMMCTAPAEILVKQATGCPVRSDLVAEVNKPKDTCVTAFFASETKLDVEGICPLDANNYVVRGIDEFGIRVTLDNNKANVLKFDSARNLWAFTYAPTDFIKYLVSVSCASNSGTCPCGAVKGLNPTPPGGTNAMIEVTPICSDATHTLT